MEHGDAEETARVRSDAEAQTDTVDHERLARLVAEQRASVAQPMMAAPPLAAAAPPPSQPKKSPALLLVLGIIVFSLLGGGIGIYLLFFSKSAKIANVNVTKGPPEQATPMTVKAELVEIPGGTFQMGRSDGTVLEGPSHSVTVQPFSMDRTEVTNAEYEQFVRETNHKAPSHWPNGEPFVGQERWPVDNVSYDDAVAFAAWRSKRDGVTYRLPTEEQWEYAARNGQQSDLYPWGNSWEDKRAVVEEPSPKPVGSLPEGKNKWGVMDLIGNVWEWTSSQASAYQGSSYQMSPEERGMMVYRGGSYATRMKETPATGTLRNWQKPSTTHPTLGFRLVREAQ
jgi:formylglycine-generating enzyme required for sulfatase activity